MWCIRMYQGGKYKRFSVGSIKELPTQQEAQQAAEYIRQIGVDTLVALIRKRRCAGSRTDLPTFSAVWFTEKLQEQEGKCAICGRTPKRLVVDHDHEDDVNRGLLCATCNTGLGMFKDDVVLLRSAVSYLESYELELHPQLHPNAA